MKYYELSYLISSDLSEEEIKLFQEKIYSAIKEEGGILADSKNPVKRKLGYPIKNRGVAYLAGLNFNLAPEKLGSLKEKLSSENQILRYLISTKKLPSVPKILARPSVSELSKIGRRGEVLRGKPSPKKILKPKEKVELKEIEKKLEEILGET